MVQGAERESMNVFEKIKEKLEDEQLTSSSAKAEAIIGMCGASANHYGGEMCAYEKAITIVEEVEKEYNEDVCEWEEKILNKELAYKNCKFDVGEISPYTFSLCPYCGKKIKIKEVE